MLLSSEKVWCVEENYDPTQHRTLTVICTSVDDQTSKTPTKRTRISPIGSIYIFLSKKITMFNRLSSFVLISFLFPSVAGFGVGQQHHSRRTTSALHVVPIETHTTVEVSNAMHSMWIATIDADVANIELEAFRKVFAGGIVSETKMILLVGFFLIIIGFRWN